MADTNSGFNTCAANDKRTWYADKYQAILFSDKDIQPTIPISETPSFVDEIRENLIATLKDKEAICPPGIPTSYEYINTAQKDFNNLFAYQFEDKRVIGALLETLPAPFMVLEYSGFDQDICGSVDIYTLTHPPDQFGCTYCESAGDDTYRIISNQDNVLSIWQDFTSKLRLEPGLFSP